MQLVDTHCHIHEPDYPLEITEVEERAAAADVTRLICVGTDVSSSQQALEFVKTRENTWASVGLHPHDAKLGGDAIKKLQAIVQADQDTKKLVAIGECGLDYFYENSPKMEQQVALKHQIDLALEYDLPLIFHVRDAFDDFWPFFDTYKGIRGVLHSFTDTRANLDAAVSRGLYIGVNGIMTFTKNDWQLEVAKNIPLEKMLLETDAPFLTPVPLRGRVNEPANVRLVAECLSKLRAESLEDIAAVTTNNARRLFNLK